MSDLLRAHARFSIVSTVLAWDNGILKKRAIAIEQNKEVVPRSVLECMKEYCRSGKEKQQLIRKRSRESSVPISAIAGR